MKNNPLETEAIRLLRERTKLQREARKLMEAIACIEKRIIELAPKTSGKNLAHFN